MCRDCGCGKGGGWHQHEDGTWHSHDHEHDHEHHHHDHSKPTPTLNRHKVVIDSTQAVLARNDQIAQNNRLWFLQNKVLTLNLISSPGTGKTLLLEKLLQALTPSMKVVVLVGDQATTLDADRLQNKGAKVRQINTHSSCHLDAPHIESELGSFVTPDTDLLIIENVGNLVCPSAFDLGEAAKVALLSCTEGEDKPVKYPSLFAQAQLVVLTKMDLVPHLNWSLTKAREQIRRLNAMAPIIETSAQTGQGLSELVSWISERVTQIKKQN
jgi:hydrogenase nickel incorporation protein HypB